jgi:hypothetical protein
MLFIQAVTYNIAEVDDGSCERLMDSSSCLAESSTLARGSNKCYWDSDTEKCHYLDASDELMRVVFVAIISAIWSAPIAIFANWLIMNVLAAKTAVSTKVESATSFRTHGIVADRNHIDSRTGSQHKLIFGKPVADEVRDLNEAVIQYKQTLSDIEQREYAGITTTLLTHYVLY